MMVIGGIMSIAVAADIINGTSTAVAMRHADDGTAEQVNILVLPYLQPYAPVLSVLLVLAKFVLLIGLHESFDKLSGL